ncbi:MAG: hypothetical protein JWO36_4339 [Myxococcales bacterium]|nr:hypothetical protein [Myxococcales bacterium]
MVAWGSLATGAVIITSWLRRRRSFEERVTTEFAAVDVGDFGVSPGGEIADSVTHAGIADVDPQPLAQVAGEGIDPDAVEAAHHELPDLRERLPQPGKNLP